MASSIEYERTYLSQEIPEQLIVGDSVSLVDVYFPHKAAHPKLRIRKKGGSYEITKKTPVDNDPSRQTEDTIPLTQEEFEELTSGAQRRVEKLRFPLSYNGIDAELDVFTGEHTGLVLVDFEFTDGDLADKFEMPDFCSADVTTEDIIAGGILSGTSSEELFASLKEKYDYKPVPEDVIKALGGASLK